MVAPIPYTTLANKTFSFTPAQREFILALRRLNHEDGNKYAEGNYLVGEWLADCCLEVRILSTLGTVIAHAVAVAAAQGVRNPQGIDPLDWFSWSDSLWAPALGVWGSWGDSTADRDHNRWGFPTG